MRHQIVNKVIKLPRTTRSSDLSISGKLAVWQVQVASEANASHNHGAHRSISEKSGSVQKRGSDKILFLHLNGSSTGACSNMYFPICIFLNTK